VAPAITSHEVRIAKDTEQLHLICGTRGYSYHDDERYAAGLLDAVLTGGYSSRLFQEIREKRGLCYNIGPMSASYRNAGFWAVETSVAPENAKETVKLLGRELRKVRERGVTKAELARAQRMTKINVLLSEESSSAQMTRIARNELCYGRQRSIDEILDSVAGVTLEDVHRAARAMFDAASFNLAAIGPAPDKLHIDL
jgi:predicted Zn-dependent peptidase